MKRAAGRTADVTPFNSVRPNMTIGVAGWRVHCGECGFLSSVHTNYGDAVKHARYHRCADSPTTLRPARARTPSARLDAQTGPDTATTSPAA